MGFYFQNNDDQFYKALFKNSVSAMLLIDFETLKIMDANFAACTFYKYSYQEMLEFKLTDLAAGDADQIYTQINLSASYIKNSFVFKHRISSGEIKNVRINSGLAEIDNKKYIHAIINDLTESEDFSRPVSQM